MVKFIVSCDPFSGFEYHLPQDSILCLEDVIFQIRQELENVFQSHHLVCLLDILKTKTFYIHGYSLMDVLSNQDENHAWYVCECPPPSS